MALTFSHLPLTLSSSTLTLSHSCYLPSQMRFSTTTLPRCSGLASSSGAASIIMDNDEGTRLKDFPYASPPIKDLMVEVISTVENRLDSMLLPCTLPQDVQYFQNQSGTSHASFLLRSGGPSSPIDFILGSWIHSELPTGGSLSITSLLSYMNDSTDAPHLVIEFIQSSPTSVVLILDLPPRKDLVSHPDYINTIYEGTSLEKQRQLLYNISEAQPYVSPSLYIRSVFSPTAVVLRVDCGIERLQQILKIDVNTAAKEVLENWLDLCALGEKRVLGDDEKALLKKRDSIFKSKSIENDIGSTLPKICDQETADRVLGVLRAFL